MTWPTSALDGEHEYLALSSRCIICSKNEFLTVLKLELSSSLLFFPPLFLAASFLTYLRREVTKKEI